MSKSTFPWKKCKNCRFFVADLSECVTPVAPLKPERCPKEFVDLKVTYNFPKKWLKPFRNALKTFVPEDKCSILEVYPKDKVHEPGAYEVHFAGDPRTRDILGRKIKEYLLKKRKGELKSNRERLQGRLQSK